MGSSVLDDLKVMKAIWSVVLCLNLAAIFHASYILDVAAAEIYLTPSTH